MPDIPIHNETGYDLTPPILARIEREAIDYFGDAIRVIRVQSGIERLAFNARTGELCYAFFPKDYGFGDAISAASEFDLSEDDAARIDDDLDDFAKPGLDDEDETEPFSIFQETVEVGGWEDDRASQRLDIDVDAIEDAASDFLD